MAIRREILLIILLVLVIAVLVKLVEFFHVDIEEADASNFVIEDLRAKYPSADLEIMSILEEHNEFGSKYFELKTKVTQDQDTACPRRSHIFYNYPAQNFVPQTPEVITNHCEVCTAGLCTIAFPEEAIIASHTFKGTGDVNSYLALYANAISTLTEDANSWTVKWNSNSADHYYVVKIHRTGVLMNVSYVEKS
ncbi:hypothetical protein KKF81_01065 [Candidatus Micrarchaeota archaeon]|nr:hypothetical protein [Candidatus Micrarchaeota archaeon]MBU1165510.1 hypothetical protein [Candidatus Micrarchaeota archaeon]MBU1887408.1 hypothetical protein [Candidatus Micrarchaeota archaeon]